MLTEKQWAALEAVVNRIIPADDAPNGWEAGVGEYLGRQFQGDLKPCLDTYRAGLDALEQEAEAAGKSPFAALSPDAQDALLARIETGDVAADWPISPVRFFLMIVDHAMEGFYADPGNGGNRDGAAWRMIGFEVRG
jgi:hypothetical protein